MPLSGSDRDVAAEPTGTQPDRPRELTRIVERPASRMRPRPVRRAPDSSRRCCLPGDVRSRVELRSAKLNVVTVIAVGDMFGIEGGREQLAGLLERFERDAQREPGCRRYTFAAT